MAELLLDADVELLHHGIAQAIVDDVDSGGPGTSERESAEGAGKDFGSARPEGAVRVEIDRSARWIGNDVAGGYVERQRAAVEALFERHDFQRDAVVVNTVAAMDGEVRIERVVEADSRTPVIQIVVACALIKRLHQRIALAIPAQVIEVCIRLPAQAEIESEVGERLPVIFGKQGKVIVVVVGQIERARGCGTTQSDSEEQVVVIDFAVVVAIEIGKVFDRLNVPLLKDTEIEVGIDGLDFAAKAQRVITPRPGENVVPLQTKLQGLLGDAIGGAVVQVGESDLRRA